MFGSRKHRPPNPPLNVATADPSAATAALNAFNRRGSSPSLSAAAAAAALKARPHTPTNVSEVQTKRTLRRSASVSSSGTASEIGGIWRPGGQLKRRGSSGSMSERTFRRSPSPHRSLSTGGIPRHSYHSDEKVPPVPSIPANMDPHASGPPMRRPKSLGMVSTPMRTASQKMAKETSGTWFGAAKTGDISTIRTSDAILSSSPPPAQNIERPSSRSSSINFSYPTNLRVASPPPSSPSLTRDEIHPLDVQSSPPQQHSPPRRRASTMSPQRQGSVRHSRPSSMTSDQTLVYDPNSRRMVPRAELLALEQQIQVASEKRPRKKKQTPTRTGSHLAKGTMGRPHGTAVEPVPRNDAQMAAAASLRSYRAEEPRHPLPREQEEFEQPVLEAASESAKPEPQREVVPQSNRQAEISTSPTLNALEGHNSRSMQPSDSLQRRPSVVREEEEPESEPGGHRAKAVSDTGTSAGLDAVPVRETVIAKEAPQPSQGETIAMEPVASPRPVPAEVPVHAPTSPPAQLSSAAEGIVAPVPIELRETSLIRRDSRTHSSSPVRNAHFGPVQNNLTVRHSPPPRSISPRKSALKQQSPSRGASPSDDTSEASGAGAATQEPVLPRKKAVRVSFDDESTVVLGEAAGSGEPSSPILSSPQSSRKTSWFTNIGRNKRKDIIPLEEDEIMQPRPALPSFGSIREKKPPPREPEERPLVRPYETTYTPRETSSPVPLKADSGMPGAENVGQSSDHAIGALLHEHGSRNEANISKYREPLPPVVTSREESGYASDSASSSSDESALVADTPKLIPEESHISQASTLVPEAVSQPKPPNGSTEAPQTVEVKDFAAALPQGRVSPTLNIPIIAVTQASPRLSDRKESRRDYLEVPGGFPETESELSDVPPSTAEGAATRSAAPARQVAFEPVVQKKDSKATAQTPATVLATQPAGQTDSDSDESSIYSDAFEDLSDMEDNGFQSLDAVVESPMITTPPKTALTSVPEAQQVTPKTPTPGQHTISALAARAQEPASPVNDWESAKAYWRSLTADKRAQLEREATEEAGIDADLEEINQEAKRPRRKKSVEKRAAEKKALQLQRAIDTDRVYMIQPGSKAAGHYDVSPAVSPKSQPPVMSKAEAGPRFRKTMRAANTQSQQGPSTAVENGGRMRKSLRTNANEQPQRRQRPSIAVTDRPMSFPPPGAVPPAPKGHERAMSDSGHQAPPRGATGLAGTLQPSLMRRGSGSSTSSFKRSRPASLGFAGFSRKTMRGSPKAQEPERDQSSRFSFRPGSPMRRGSVQSPPVSMGNARMRTTLRGSRRDSQDSEKGYLPLSGTFGRLSGRAGGKSKRSSRFDDDSSDEGADVNRPIRSRFEDSSDDDIAPEPLPRLIMPLTSKGKASDSPPLPEEEEDFEGSPSDDEKAQQITQLPSSHTEGALATTSLRRNRSGRGGIVNPQTAPDVGAFAATGRPSGGRRGSLMAILRRRKHDTGNKVSRPELMDSAARRDTNLERSASQLGVMRSNSLRSNSIPGRLTTTTPKLHKRVGSVPAGGPGGSAGWPLPDEPEQGQAGVKDETIGDEKAADIDDRSGSLLRTDSGASRPQLKPRRTLSTQGSIRTDGVGVDGQAQKRKKKFGALRRMFKLDD